MKRNDNISNSLLSNNVWKLYNKILYASYFSLLVSFIVNLNDCINYLFLITYKNELSLVRIKETNTKKN